MTGTEGAVSPEPISGLRSAASAPVQPVPASLVPAGAAGCGCVVPVVVPPDAKVASPAIDGAVGSSIGSRPAAADGSVAIVAIAPLDGGADGGRDPVLGAGRDPGIGARRDAVGVRPGDELVCGLVAGWGPARAFREGIGCREQRGKLGKLGTAAGRVVAGAGRDVLVRRLVLALARGGRAGGDGGGGAGDRGGVGGVVRRGGHREVGAGEVDRQLVGDLHRGSAGERRRVHGGSDVDRLRRHDRGGVHEDGRGRLQQGGGDGRRRGRRVDGDGSDGRRHRCRRDPRARRRRHDRAGGDRRDRPRLRSGAGQGGSRRTGGLIRRDGRSGGRSRRTGGLIHRDCRSGGRGRIGRRLHRDGARRPARRLQARARPAAARRRAARKRPPTRAARRSRGCSSPSGRCRRSAPRPPRPQPRAPARSPGPPTRRRFFGEPVGLGFFGSCVAGSSCAPRCERGRPRRPRLPCRGDRPARRERRAPDRSSRSPCPE